METKKLTKIQNMLLDRVLAEFNAKRQELLAIINDCGLELGVPTNVPVNVEEVIEKREFNFEEK